ncbi:enoyl-CoA hydratase/isomerase family protein [Jatrophihabitans sp. DSM 45814]
MTFEPPDSLLYEARNGVCYITLNRPQAMNALNLELQRAVPRAFQEFDSDDSLYVAILSGAGGRAFSAGADLKEMTEFVGTDDDPRRTGARTDGPSVMSLDQCSKPVIAAVDGYAFAGGCELTLMCDIRLATKKSSFAIPEVKRSLIAGPGTTHLPRMIPIGEALRMTLTGEPITAERAYQIGLVQGLAEDREDLFRQADEMAAVIAANPPLAVADVKHVVRVGANMPLEHAMLFREKYFDMILQTEDAKEGAAAFAEKRPPIWKRR